MASSELIYQKFVTFARTAGKSGDFGPTDAIQFNEKGELGDAEYNVGRLGRVVDLTNHSHRTIRANNEVRAQFLKAVVRQFGDSLDNLPQAVKTALKLEDYGLEKNKDGTYNFTSGRPLTVRRICQVLTAVSSAQVDIQEAKQKFDELWTASQTVAPGQRLMAREQVMAEVLMTDPVFTENGKLSVLGRKTCSAAEKVFRDRMNALDPVGQNAYLRDFGNKAREAAESVKSLTLKLRASIERMLPNAASKDAHGALRHRILVERLTGIALEKIVITPKSVVGISEKELLANLKDAREDLEKEQQDISTAFEMTTEITNAIGKAYGFEVSEKAFEAQVRCLLDAGGGFISAMDRHTVDQTHAKREADFIQMFARVYGFIGGDKDKALEVYSQILHLGVSKSKYIPGAVELANLFVGKRVAFPANATKDNCRAFLENLQKATLDKGQEITARFKEFGSDDIHQIEAAFISLLMAAHPEFKESFAQVSDAVMADLETQVDYETAFLANISKTDEAVNLRALAQILIALEGLR